MSMAEDMRQYLIDEGIGVGVENGGSLSVYHMPALPTYSITVYEFGGLRPEGIHSADGTDYKLIKGLQIKMRARQDQIDQQELDAERIMQALNYKSNFIANNHPYLSVIAQSSGYLNLGWEGDEDESRVRYIALNFEVAMSK